MTVGFRTKVFAAALGVAAAALAVATVIIAWELRGEERTVIERRLRDQALLIAELLAQNPGVIRPGHRRGSRSARARPSTGASR